MGDSSGQNAVRFVLLCILASACFGCPAYAITPFPNDSSPNAVSGSNTSPDTPKNEGIFTHLKQFISSNFIPNPEAQPQQATSDLPASASTIHPTLRVTIPDLQAVSQSLGPVSNPLADNKPTVTSQPAQATPVQPVYGVDIQNTPPANATPAVTNQPAQAVAAQSGPAVVAQTAIAPSQPTQVAVAQTIPGKPVYGIDIVTINTPLTPAEWAAMLESVHFSHKNPPTTTIAANPSVTALANLSPSAGQAAGTEPAEPAPLIPTTAALEPSPPAQPAPLPPTAAVPQPAPPAQPTPLLPTTAVAQPAPPAQPSPLPPTAAVPQPAPPVQTTNGATNKDAEKSLVVPSSAPASAAVSQPHKEPLSSAPVALGTSQPVANNSNPVPEKKLSAESKKVVTDIIRHAATATIAPSNPVAIDRASAAGDSQTKSHESMGIKMEVKTPNVNLDYELEKAYNASVAGQSEEAILIYKSVLDIDPRNQNALFGLATTYHRTGQLAMARPLYARLLTIDPNNRDGLNNFLVLLADEAPEEALTQLQQLQRSNPNYSPIPAQMAVICQKLGEPGPAADNMRHAIALSPENLTYRYNFAVMLDMQHQYAEAIQLYREIIQAYQRGEMIPGNIEKIQQRLTFISSNKH